MKGREITVEIIIAKNIIVAKNNFPEYPTMFNKKFMLFAIVYTIIFIGKVKKITVPLQGNMLIFGLYLMI